MATMTVRFDPAHPETFAEHLAAVMGRCRHGAYREDCPDCRAEAMQDRRDWGEEE